MLNLTICKPKVGGSIPSAGTTVPTLRAQPDAKPCKPSPELARQRIEQRVHVHDELAHMGIVDRALGGAFPGLVRLGVVRENPDDVELG